MAFQLFSHLFVTDQKLIPKSQANRGLQNFTYTNKKMRKLIRYSVPVTLSLLFGFALFFQACEKSLDSGDPGGGGGGGGGNGGGSGTTVSTNLRIQVMNENQMALPGVLVTVYSSSGMTDAAGNLFLANVAIPVEEASRMKVLMEKEGFFSNTIGLSPKINAETYTQAVLMEKELAGSFNNSSGGAAATQEQEAQVNVAPNSYATKDGNAYTGETKVYMNYLDPTKEDFVLAMPGGADLWAKNEAGEEGTLESFGAVFMKCETPEGEELVPTPAAKFDFCVVIPQSLMSVAPQQIQVWYINPNGEWTPYIMAQKTGNQYCFVSNTDGQINCDIFGRSAFLEGTVCDNNQQPAPKVRVKANERIAYTDAEGKFSMLVQANIPLRLKTDYCEMNIQGLQPASLETVAIGCEAGGCNSGSIFDVTLDGQPIEIKGGFFGDQDNILVLGGWETESDPWKIYLEWELHDYNQIVPGNYSFGEGELYAVSGMLEENNAIQYWANENGGGSVTISSFEPGVMMQGSFNSMSFVEEYPNQGGSTRTLNGTFLVTFYTGGKKQIQNTFK